MIDPHDPPTTCHALVALVLFMAFAVCLGLAASGIDRSRTVPATLLSVVAFVLVVFP